MHSVNQEKISTLEAALKDRFADFNKSGAASGRRRYSRELKDLVIQAEIWTRTATICRLSGLSACTVHRCPRSAKAKPIQPRRLTIVDTKPRHAFASVVIRLPSGVAIELGDGRELNFDLLKSLSALTGGEVR